MANKPKFLLRAEPELNGESVVGFDGKHRFTIPARLRKIVSDRNRYNLHSTQFKLAYNQVYAEVDIIYKDAQGNEHLAAILTNPILPRHEKEPLTADDIDLTVLDEMLYATLREADDFNFICLYSALDWAMESARHKLNPPENEDRRNFFRASKTLYQKDQHRIVLPKDFADHAGLEGKVKLIGNGNLIEMWNPATEKLYGAQKSK